MIVNLSIIALFVEDARFSYFTQSIGSKAVRLFTPLLVFLMAYVLWLHQQMNLQNG
jgi:hypothetical protein